MMRVEFDTYFISDDKSLLDLETIRGFLKRSYWASDRPYEITIKSVDNSHCYGAYDKNNRQIGFARVITDDATMFYICDVFIDEGYRGQGIGKALISRINSDHPGLTGVLATKDAHTLYEQLGYVRDAESYMKKPRN